MCGMKHVILASSLVAASALAGCAEFDALFDPNADMAAVDAMPEPAATLDPTPPPPPPETATTAEEFDTTSEEDRAAALEAPAEAGEAEVGRTLATLGDPADPGIWLSTPLVDELVMGRVEVAETGASAAMELRPSGGEPGSGSEISLPAMRLLEIPFTAIQELVVYVGSLTS